MPFPLPSLGGILIATAVLELNAEERLDKLDEDARVCMAERKQDARLTWLAQTAANRMAECPRAQRLNCLIYLTMLKKCNMLKRKMSLNLLF